LRTLLIGALAATLVGCSRQPPPPQAATSSCTGANGLPCLERKAGPPIKLVSLRTNSAATNSHRGRLASTTAKPAQVAAKAAPPASRIPLPPDSSNTRRQPAGSAAAESRPTIGVANTRTIEAQVAAATVLAERLTATTTAPPPDMKADNADLLVAVLMARPDIKSVSDLAGKTIAVDDRYSASNGIVRTAIVAAGAPEVQLSEGHTTAIDRLANGEVPAAVLALVSADAAEGFPEIAGFRIFHIPLSPRSLKGRP